MACNAPIAGWKARESTAKGKRPVVFRMAEGYSDLAVTLPCGVCAGCRLSRAREWSVRCMHEAQMYEDNCFVTLTYNDASVPRLEGGLETLRPRDFVLFMKRLRKVKPGVRFFQCGEYGELGRPHHHALLFNCSFGDRTVWSRSRDNILYRSEELENLWRNEDGSSKGFSSVGDVSVESAGYVARYTTKKAERAEGRERAAETSPAGSAGRVKEYLTMSRGGRKAGGIGLKWIEKFMSDVYPSDEVVVSADMKIKPPRYYDEQLEKRDPELLKRLEARREEELSEEYKSGDRQISREKIMRKRVSDQLRRHLP